MIQVDYTQARQLLKQAFVALLKQGAYGMDGGGCTYLNGEGQSCIAGLALKIVDPSIELDAFRGPAGDLQSPLQEAGQAWTREAIDLLQAAQAVHDRASDRHSSPFIGDLLAVADGAVADAYHPGGHTICEILRELEAETKEQS